MATTTNYGWTTPDDTALVKDGASTIRTLGTSVDTTTKNLNPETTLGDIAYRSSTSNVNTRLGIGSTGQILTVASGVPSWATPAAGGGLTLINTGGTTLTGASVTIGSIPSTYKNLQLVVRSYRPASNGQSLNLRFNSDSSTNYSYIFTGMADNNSFGNNIWDIARSQNSGASNCLSVVNIFDYTNTSTWKTAHIVAFSNTSANIAQFSYVVGGAVYNQTAAISSIDLFPASGNFTSGTAFLYGES